MTKSNYIQYFLKIMFNVNYLQMYKKTNITKKNDLDLLELKSRIAVLINCQLAINKRKRTHSNLLRKPNRT
jgi:hypothetical protein